MYSNFVINPRSILGQLHYGGEYAWGVEAYDVHGNRISDSFGYGGFVSLNELPLFKLAEKVPLTPADRLLLEQRYDEAIAAYKSILNDNTHDFHSLLVLARLYQYGVRLGEQDFDKAAEYYRRLLEVEDIPEVRKALADVYLSAGEDRFAYELYLSLLDIPDVAWDTYHNLSKTAFRLGRPAEALELSQQATEMKHGLYTRAYPVALALVLGDTEKAMILAEKVDGGDRYLPLLTRYAHEGYTISDAAKDAVLAGDYHSATELESNEHGSFIQGLLIYLENREGYRDVLSQLLGEMKHGLHSELLRYMIN